MNSARFASTQSSRRCGPIGPLSDRAVGVILSGSGSDGSRGIQEIHKAGGIVFCESPDTAQFNGMPLSAMRAGVVDHVLPPEEIATAIASLDMPVGDGDNSSVARVELLSSGLPGPEQDATGAVTQRPSRGAVVAI